MIHIWRKIVKTGVVTRKDPFLPPSKKNRGKLFVHIEKCDHCDQCVSLCPADAISFEEEEDKATISFDYGACMYCGICADLCPSGAIEQVNDPKESVKNPEELIEAFVIDNAGNTGERGTTDAENR